MDEIVNQYLPQIITAIVGVVSTGGCAGLLTYLTRQFNKLKGSTEIAQIRDMTHKIVETNKSLVAENLALKQELEELLKAIYTGKVTEYKEKVDEVLNHNKEV